MAHIRLVSTCRTPAAGAPVELKAGRSRGRRAPGVGRATAHKWLTTIRAEGWRSPRPDSSDPSARPGSPPPETVEAILRTPVERRSVPHRLAPLLGLPARPCMRSGAIRLLAGCATATAFGVPVRYVREHPGEPSTRTTRSSAGSPTAAATGSWAAAKGRATDGGHGYDHSRSSSTTSAGRLVALVPDERASSAARR